MKKGNVQFGFLIARQRSGTHALRSVLETREDVKALGEVLYGGKLDPENDTQFYNIYLDHLRREPEKILDSLGFFMNEYLDYIKDRYRGVGHILFDIKYNSLGVLQPAWPMLDTVCIPPMISRILKSGSIVINITRRQYLKQYVSEMLARENKIFATTRDVSLKKTSVRIDVAHMLGCFERYHREDQIIKDLFVSHEKFISFDYDEFFLGEECVRAEILDKINGLFGGGPGLKYEIQYKKLNTKTLSDSIENFKDVTKCLEGTPFAYCLQERVS